MQNNVTAVTPRLLAMTCLLALLSCSDKETTTSCPVCEPGTICDQKTGFCVEEEQTCGPHTAKGGSCSCLSGWFDCNEDLSASGGNGCECSGGCDGAECDDSKTPECSPDVEMDCEFSDFFCDGESCAPCPGDKLNCDGLEECTCEGVCDGTTCDESTPPECSAQKVMDCDDDEHYCSGGKCTPCPGDKLNCDGIGGCTCEGTCEGETCKEGSNLSCFDLELQYGGALIDARECDPTASPDPCTYEVTGDITCNCTIWVNDTKTSAIAIMEHAKAAALQKGCSYTCPPHGCADYTSSTCESLPNGGGDCTYH